MQWVVNNHNQAVTSVTLFLLRKTSRACLIHEYFLINLMNQGSGK